MEGTELFWSIAEALMERGVAESGTLMGHDCLRLGGEFVAMADGAERLVVKLNADRVADLIEDGTGAPFAPAGRAFREWVLVAEPDRERWTELIEEAVALRSD